MGIVRWSGNRTRDDLLVDIGLGRKIASIVAKRLTRLLIDQGSRPDALMLTMSEDEADLAAALRGGACGYLLKTVDGDALAQSIVRTMRGESVVSPEMTGKLVAAFQANSAAAAAPPAAAPAPADPIDSLSPRERQILGRIARGASNKEIGRALDIAETTVKIHVQHILRKLGFASRVQAAVYASERGIG